MKPLLVVDGYNVIGAWSDVSKKEWSIDEARDQLIHILLSVILHRTVLHEIFAASAFFS